MTDFNTLLEQYSEQIEAFNKLREQLALQLKSQFGGIVKGFFEANPIVEGIIWSQYTPYFNDGDECIFNVHDKYAVFKAPEGFEGDTFEDMYRGWDAEASELGFIAGAYGSSYGGPSDEMRLEYGEAAGKAWADFRNLSSALDKIPEEVYKETFGDHVTIKVTREGISIDECDHD